MFAAFPSANDVHLVSDLLANICPAIHGDVAWDDRAADTSLSDESARRTRLITTDQLLHVRAARNIGVAVSRAPYLAFLAGDCLARPGWVAGRVSLRHAGAQAVATAVVGAGDASLVALAATPPPIRAICPFAASPAPAPCCGSWATFPPACGWAKTPP